MDDVTKETIETVAQTRAEIAVERGWEGMGTYHLSLADRAEGKKRLGRYLTNDEESALENAIRGHLVCHDEAAS